MNALLFSPQDNLTLRVLRLFVGMFLAAFGISTITTAGLGTTPISTLPFVLAVLSGYSFGQTTFLVNVVFVIGQFMLLGRKLPWWNIFQLAAVFVFSAFIDLSMFLIAALKPESWGGQLLMSLAGNLFLALGIVLQISSKTLVQPGEGIVLAIAVRLQRSFGDIKVRSDIVLVCLAAILGFGCSRSFIGLREGTLISALLVGFLVKKIQGIDHKPAQLKEVSFQPNEKS